MDALLKFAYSQLEAQMFRKATSKHNKAAESLSRQQRKSLRTNPEGVSTVTDKMYAHMAGDNVSNLPTVAYDAVDGYAREQLWSSKPGRNSKINIKNFKEVLKDGTTALGAGAVIGSVKSAIGLPAVDPSTAPLIAQVSHGLGAGLRSMFRNSPMVDRMNSTKQLKKKYDIINSGWGEI